MTGTGRFGLAWDEAEPGGLPWQGIRSLGLTDPAPPGLAAELRVELQRPASGLGPQDFSIAGPDGSAPDFTVAVGDGDTAALVRFPPPAGQLPRGTHVARMASGGADPLNPFFAEASFDFYIDCPAGDCRDAPPGTAPSDAAEPAVDLATKDYRGFLEVGRNWAVATDRNWSDLSPASVEGTLLELLAHHAEMLSLYQDRVAQEAFLDTARERISLARHAAFLGLDLDQGDLATTVVAVDVAVAGYLPQGTPIERRERGGEVTSRFETTEAVLLDPRWNAGLGAVPGSLALAAWPDAGEAVLPAGTTGLYLFGWGLGLSPGQRIAFVQGSQAHLATLDSIAEVQEPGWTAAPTDLATTDPAELTRITWDRPTAAVFAPWIDPVALPFLVTANLADARHGDTRRAATVPQPGGIGLSTGRRDAVFATDPATGQTLLRALRTPEDMVLQDAATGRPALELAIGGTAWSWQRDLLSSAGFDRHFTTEREDDGSIWVIFGDGERGAALVAGPGSGLPAEPIELDYRRGDPAAGNIGAFGLNAVGRFPEGDDRGPDLDALAVSAATNVLTAAGGRRAVPLDTARQLIPDSIRHPALERCVTTADYESAAAAVAGVAQAAAKPLGGIFNTIAILVAPEAGDALDPDLQAEVHAAIEALRMAGREHVVRAPDYLPLDIAILLCPAAGAGPGAVRSQARAALVPGPAGTGFFHRSRLGFGAEVRLADILAAIQAQPAIGAVRALAFRPLFASGGPPVRPAIRLGPTEVAQFAGDEARPEFGRLTLRVEGVDPPAPPPAAFIVGGPAPEDTGASP